MTAKATEFSVLAEGLRKNYGDKRALDGFDLAVPRGTVYGLLGPNGAGKTTAVRILSTLVRLDGGRATVGGHDGEQRTAPRPTPPATCTGTRCPRAAAGSRSTPD